ncbi:MAG: hypothetical protein ACMXYA_02625, partial [Candidatus Woesearchaeota archaeon]
ASIIVEEALEKKIPAVIFDPTAQWTGFLHQLQDKNIFKKYATFSLREEDAKSYKGLIYTPTNENFDVEFEKYTNPGETTVFNLSNLSVKEYDKAVKNIIDTIIEKKWEESPDLQLLVVFDEVHRLLDPAAEGVGYEALIKAAREFRKWGIGLIMSSQVSSDFKEAIGGNVLTEVQLNTKNIEDIKKIEEKYGAEYSDRITRQGVGVGLVQNPKYNKGQPWFIEFRPPFHNPHKLPEEDLAKYDSFTRKLNEIFAVIEYFKKAGINVDDYMMDYNLANNKLKEGKFRMVQIYVEDLEQSLAKESQYKKAVENYKSQQSQAAQPSSEKNSASNDKQVQKIKAYIEKYQKQGYSLTKLQKHLESQNIPKHIIQKALEEIEK